MQTPVILDKIRTDGSNSIHAVGEASYQDELEFSAKRRQFEEDQIQVELLVVFQPQPNNPHDPNAIAIKDNETGQTLAYIAKAQAAHLAWRLLNHPRKFLVHATIFTNHDYDVPRSLWINTDQASLMHELETHGPRKRPNLSALEQIAERRNKGPLGCLLAIVGVFFLVGPFLPIGLGLLCLAFAVFVYSRV